jgi:autotransporter family porin
MAPELPLRGHLFSAHALLADGRPVAAVVLADLTPQLGESFPAIPGSGFTITGASPNRDAALLGVGVRYKTSSGLAVYADYEATVGQREIDHSVIAGLKFTW